MKCLRQCAGTAGVVNLTSTGPDTAHRPALACPPTPGTSLSSPRGQLVTAVVTAGRIVAPSPGCGELPVLRRQTAPKRTVSAKRPAPAPEHARDRPCVPLRRSVSHSASCWPVPAGRLLGQRGRRRAGAGQSVRSRHRRHADELQHSIKQPSGEYNTFIVVGSSRTATGRGIGSSRTAPSTMMTEAVAVSHWARPLHGAARHWTRTT